MAYNLEEQESIDNLKGWWEKWGTPVLVVITLACVGVAGYNGWKWWNHRQTAKASVAYVALETAVNNQDGKNIKSISDGLIDQYGSTVYGPMAAFVAARYAADNGDIATAKQKLQWVVDHGDRKEFEAIARVRLAGLLMDEKSYDKALSIRSSDRVSSCLASSMTSTRSRSASASIKRGLTVSPKPSSAV